MPGTIDALAPLKDATTATLGDALVGYRPVTPGGVAITGSAASTVHGKLRGMFLDAVEDFQADPTGVADSTVPLQNLLDACFGPVSAPNGWSTPRLNKWPYLPAGNYKLTAALNLKYVLGAYLLGAGPFATTLVQTAANTPILNVNGFSYSRLEGIRFLANASSNNLNALVEIYSDGTGYACQSNTVANCVFEGNAQAAVGLRVGGNTFEGGSLGGNMGSEFSYLNCFWVTCTLAGLYINGFNALAHTLVGGNVQNCNKFGVYGQGGSVAIYGTGFQANVLAQIDNGGFDVSLTQSANDISILSNIRSESAKLVNAANSHEVVVDACNLTPGLVNFAAWQASHAYALNALTSANGSLFRVTTAGTSGATAPAWTFAGGTVTDGSVVWTHQNHDAAALTFGRLSNSRFAYGAVNAFGQNSPVQISGCGFTRTDWLRANATAYDTECIDLEGNYVWNSGGVNNGTPPDNWSITSANPTSAFAYTGRTQKRLQTGPLVFGYAAGGNTYADVGLIRSDGAMSFPTNTLQNDLSRNVLALLGAGVLGRPVQSGTNLAGLRTSVQGGLGTGNAGGGGVALRDQTPGASGASVPDAADVLVAAYNGVQVVPPITLLNNQSVLVTAGSGSPEGVVTANPGSTYQRTNPSGLGTALYTKESGNGNTGWKSLAESAQGGIVLTRTLPTVAGQEVDLGTFTLTQGAGTFRISVSVNSTGFSVAKVFETSVGFPASNLGWQRLQPIEDSGPYSGQDFFLDVNVLNNTVALRLYRAAGQGTTAGAANVLIHHEGDPNSTFAASAASGAAAAAVGYYGPAAGRVIPAVTAGLAWPQTTIQPRDLVPVDVVCPGALVGDLAVVSLDSLVTATLDASGLPITNSVLLTQASVAAVNQATFGVWNISNIAQTVPAGQFRVAVMRVV